MRAIAQFFFFYTYQPRPINNGNREELDDKKFCYQLIITFAVSKSNKYI